MTLTFCAVNLKIPVSIFLPRQENASFQKNEKSVFLDGGPKKFFVIRY
jgi:hypothetical protein